MKPSESLYVDVRGLRYHVRRWGRAGAPKVFLFHGWMDVSADRGRILVHQNPIREQITVPIQEQLIVEYYSKI